MTRRCASFFSLLVLQSVKGWFLHGYERRHYQPSGAYNHVKRGFLMQVPEVLVKGKRFLVAGV
ncbi:MAG: hypothetical protein ONB30_13470 [candidate division KSB1 bacterium]|nr:hypothetical protein [candidate division KSB1 bacterium]